MTELFFFSSDQLTIISKVTERSRWVKIRARELSSLRKFCLKTLHRTVTIPTFICRTLQYVNKRQSKRAFNGASMALEVLTIRFPGTNRYFNSINHPLAYHVDGLTKVDFCKQRKGVLITHSSFVDSGVLRNNIQSRLNENSLFSNKCLKLAFGSLNFYRLEEH